jgi:hypothetical protein
VFDSRWLTVGSILAVRSVGCDQHREFPKEPSLQNSTKLDGDYLDDYLDEIGSGSPHAAALEAF